MRCFQAIDQGLKFQAHFYVTPAGGFSSLLCRILPEASSNMAFPKKRDQREQQKEHPRWKPYCFHDLILEVKIALQLRSEDLLPLLLVYPDFRGESLTAAHTQGDGN